MPKSITFVLPGKPLAKQRPRVAANGRMYTPKQTVNYENFVRYVYLQQKKRLWFTQGCWISYQAFFKVPKGTSKVKTQKMLDGVIDHTKKPDGDNILKIIMDGLTGAAYPDDKLVTRCLGWQKNYTLDYERIEVTLTYRNEGVDEIG